MTNQPIITTKETPRQRQAFLDYFGLQEERSISRLYREYTKKDIKISEISLKKWSAKYKWQARVSIMDQEVTNRAEELAIKQASTKKSDILRAVKNTMIKYNQALLAGEIVPTTRDFHQMWEIQRKELHQDTETPSSEKIDINPKILEIVRKAEEEAYAEIQREIKNERDKSLDL